MAPQLFASRIAAELLELLGHAQQLGFVGLGSPAVHLEHALSFAAAVGDPEPSAVLDLGTGAGLPGLVLACAWRGANIVLLDSSARKARFLNHWAARLGLDSRVGVLRERAETAGHCEAWRGQFDLVVARAFGAPAVTAECAAPFLQIGGRLIVSEPPDGSDSGMRWPAGPLSGLGLRPTEELRNQYGFQVLEQVEPCPGRFSRRAGLPAKRPLF